MPFFQDANIKRGFADLISFFRETRGGHRPFLLLLACVPTAIIVYTFYLDLREKSKPPPPEITYINSWPMGRTAQESMRAMAKFEIERDRQRAAEREAYKALGRASGMDVDAIEREALAEQTAKRNAKAAQTKTEGARQ